MNREVVVVGANNEEAADPVIEHADTPNVLLVLMVLSPYRNTSHFSLRHLPFNMNREVVVVGANNEEAADPVIEHADTPNVLLVLEEMEGVFSLHRQRNP